MTTKHVAVFIGSFQPFHRGHKAVIDAALSQADDLIIVVGSKDRSPSFRNAFSYKERIELIKSSLNQEERSRVFFTGVYDTDYNNMRWVLDVQSAVDIMLGLLVNGEAKVSLIGHKKDNTSFYLKMFPQWDSIAVDNYKGLSATAIREKVYTSDGSWVLDEEFARKYFVTDEAFNYFVSLTQGPRFKLLMEEWKNIQSYKAKWWHMDPTTKEYIVPTFNTVDAVVTLGGNILLIERGNFPGRGQWALPGGFLNSNERIEDAVIRELHEETRLTVPKPVLRGAIDSYMVADQIDRDPRGRIITHAYHINLTTYGSDPQNNYKIVLPKVKGSDDAKKAKWFTLTEFNSMREQIFADHFSIANKLIDEQGKSKW